MRGLWEAAGTTPWAGALAGRCHPHPRTRDRGVPAPCGSPCTLPVPPEGLWTAACPLQEERCLQRHGSAQGRQHPSYISPAAPRPRPAAAAGNGANAVERKTLLSHQPGLRRAHKGTEIASRIKGHSLHVPFLHLSLSTGTLGERTQTPSLILCFLPPCAHPPACQPTSPSSSLACKRRANHSANTVIVGFWGTTEDLVETLPCFRAPGTAGPAAGYHPHVTERCELHHLREEHSELCLPNWRGLTPNRV